MKLPGSPTVVVVILTALLAGCQSREPEPEPRTVPSGKTEVPVIEAPAEELTPASLPRESPAVVPLPDTVRTLERTDSAGAGADGSEQDIPLAPGVHHPLDATLEACQEAANWTTQGVVRCLGQSTRAWEDELDAQYDSLMDAIEGDRARIVRAAQRAWTQYRDREAQVIEAVYSPRLGTIWRTISAGSVMDLARDRALELRDYRSLASGQLPVQSEAVTATPIDSALETCRAAAGDNSEALAVCQEQARTTWLETLTRHARRLQEGLDPDLWGMVSAAQKAWEAFRVAESRAIAAFYDSQGDLVREEKMLDLVRTRIQQLEAIQEDG